MVGVFGLLTARRVTLAFAVLLIVAGLAGRLAAAAESQGPSASFAFDPGTGLSGETISFTSTSSDDGTIIAEEWDFDDGSAGSGQQVDHAFAVPGVYTVSLTVTDDETLSAVETHTVTIQNRNPTADFHYSPASPLPDETVQFTSDATDPEDRVDVVRWDFDNDGQFDATGATAATSFSTPGAHTVVLKVEDQDGGTDTISKTVDVVDPPNQLPNAGFNFSPAAPFALQNVIFTSTATDPDGSIALKEWDFEDDGIYDASGHQVQHAYLFANDYTVRQRVTDNEGATAEITKVVTVGSAPNDPPTADFTVSPVSPKTLEDVTFTSTSTDGDGTIVTYGWELDGDNDFDDRLGSSFSSIFSPAGQYTITLKVIDEDGASATKSKTITIANRQPTADFEFAPAAPQKNENVTFTSLSSDPENRIDTLEWDLDGDNQYDDGTGPTAQTSFGSPGGKTVRLKVTDLEGGSHTVSKTVTVANKPPTASFVFSPDTPLSLQRVTFTSTASDTDGAITDVRWDLDNDGSFDDGSDIEASRIFDTAGNKTVRLRVTDDDGNQATTSHVVPVTNRAPTAVIDAPTAAQKNVDIVIKSISTDLDGSIASTQWDTDGDGYDDGTGSQITKRFTSTGPKTIKLKVTDNLGAVDEDTHVIDIGGNTAPVAGFNASSIAPLTGVLITLTSTSSDPDGSIATLAWDLDGDGNFDDGSKSPITRLFAVPGPQIVRLRVTDNEGATDVIAKTISVGNRAPTAIVTASPASPLSLDQVTFTSTATDPDGTIASRLWDLDNDGQFDDGLGVSVSQPFPKKGIYTVKVKVTDDFGASATGTAQVTVQNRLPLATFTHGPASPNPRDAVTMTSTSLDLDGVISLVEWDTDNDGAFDDGTGPTASRTFTTSGIKTARLRVTDNDGGQAIGSQTIVVGNRPPVASFDYRPAAPVVDQPVTFFSTADDPDKNIESIEWDLDGDGGFEAGGSTTSRQFPAGSFNVSMRVTDTEGSFAIVTQTIVVGVPPAPQADTGARLRALSPFPLVRMAGRIGSRGTRLRLLSVDAPKGSTITVRCRGRSCPFSKSTRAASTGKLVSAARQVRIRKLEKRLLRPGVLIKVYVTKAGAIGKYTSIKIRKGKPPKRSDRCLMPGDTKPVQCPS
jgi:large repetitive protein